MAAKKRKSPSINHRGVMHIAHGNVNPKTHHESRWQEHRSGLPETERPKYVGRRLWHGQPASIFASRRRDGHTGEPQLYYVQTDATRMRMAADSDVLGRCGLACGFLGGGVGGGRQPGQPDQSRPIWQPSGAGMTTVDWQTAPKWHKIDQKEFRGGAFSTVRPHLRYLGSRYIDGRLVRVWAEGELPWKPDHYYRNRLYAQEVT